MSTDDLKKWGLTEEQIKSVMEQFGKDISKLQRENETIKTDRDKWKTKAETAEETLKGFDGVDLEQIKKDLADWKQKAEDAEKNAQKQLYERDFNDALKTEMDSYKFTSEAAKRDVFSQIKAAELKLKDGKILGLSDLIGQIKKVDASAFVDEQQERNEQGRARFTQPTKPDSGARFKAPTRQEIASISDRAERQRAIAENLSLFGKGE